MSTLRISDAPLLPDVDGTEKIPTGGRGDFAISVDQIKGHIFQDIGKELVGLGNVDNTSDLDKPVSTAQQVALNLKADKTYVDTNLDLKADKTNVYTRSETTLALSQKADLVNGVVPESQIPSSFNDVLEFTTLNLPIIGESGKIYVTTDNNKTWRWATNKYVEISGWNPDSVSKKLTVPTYYIKESGVDPVTGVADGAYFNVRSSSDELYVDEYQNVGGSAVPTGKRYLSAYGVEQQEKPASTIKDSSGLSQQGINDARVVAVDSIADLLALPLGQLKEGMRYLVAGYRGGWAATAAYIGPTGGGEFYWDATSTQTANDGTILGSGTGRFKRLFSGNVEVSWFGAIADGVTDSTTSLQKAVTFYGTLRGGNPNSDTGFIGNHWPKIILDNGTYVSGQITTPVIVYIESKGKTVIKSLTGTKELPMGSWIDNQVTHGRVEDVKFIHFDKALIWPTNNADMSKHELLSVEAAHCNTVLDQVSFPLGRSTLTVLDRCRSSYGVKQFARIFSDKSTISNGWFVQSEDSILFHINSLCGFSNNIIVPDGTGKTNKAVIFFESTDAARSLTIDTCRFGAEPGQATIVVVGEVNTFGANEAYRNQGVTIRNSQLNSFGAYDPSGIGGVTANVVLLETGNPNRSINFVTFEDCYCGPDKDAGVVQFYGVNDPSLSLRDDFVITFDRTTAQSATRSNNRPAAENLMRYVSAPLLANRLKGPVKGSGRAIVLPTAITGQRKVSFKVDLGQGGVQLQPMALMVVLEGTGDTGAGGWGYGYSSVYILTVSFRHSGTLKAALSFTKLHGSVGGLDGAANADIISAHFGTGDTGSNEMVTSSSSNDYSNVDVTIAFGTRMGKGKAYIRPLSDSYGRI